MPVEFSIFCGDVVATDHTEEVSGSSMHGNGSIWTDVHRELWIRQHDGLERKFSFSNIDVPARQGQPVALLLDGARSVAFINFSTEQYVNLVALNQFELFGAAEVFSFAALLIAAGFTVPAGVITLLLGATAYGLVKHRARKHWFCEKFARVEAQIRRTIAHPPAACSIFARASSKLKNQCWFKHSCRNQPLNALMWALYFCLPRAGKAASSPCSRGQRSCACEANPGLSSIWVGDSLTTSK